MYSLYSKSYKNLEKERIARRIEIQNKYKRLAIPKSRKTFSTTYCPKCGYETYDNPNYCIICGSEFNRDDDYFKNAINKIRLSNGKIPKSIAEKDVLKLKNDDFFKNDCSSYLLCIFYIFTRKIFSKDETMVIFKNFNNMSEINRFLTLSQFYKCVIVSPSLIGKKLENWEGFDYLLNYEDQEISDFEFVSRLCLKYIRHTHIMSQIYTRHPNYKSIKSYWDSHAEDDLSIGGYALGLIELVDGFKKAYDLDIRKKAITTFDEDEKRDYVDGELCLKLKAMWKMICLDTNGDYYKKLWYELIAKCQLHPKDERDLIWDSCYEWKLR